MADARTEQLREMAEHRGLRLIRSRRRKPGGDYGCYGLTDRTNGKPVFGVDKDKLTATDAQIEDYLRKMASATWQSSVRQAGSGRKAAAPDKPARHASPGRATRRAPNVGASPKKAAPRPRAEPVTSHPKPVVKPASREAEIRKAVAADATRLRALLAEMTKTTPPKDLKPLIAAHARQRLPILIADDGTIVGMIAMLALTLPHRAEPVGRIATLVVAKARQREGIGKRLLEAAETALRASGCTRIEAVAEIDFTGAGGFFRACGYDRSTYRFDRVLD